MNKLSRRDFLKAAGASASLALLPTSLRAQTAEGRVVVIGGGFGGGAAAKFLKLWSPSLNVTLVEPGATYHSCIMSNLLYAGRIRLQDLELNYNATRNRGINVIQDRAMAVDAAAHTVTLGDGSTLPYDKLVMAPGIDFLYPAGLETPEAQARVPHAWKDMGAQGPMLRSMLQAIPNGGTFVVTVPPVPYRCPPGPYERACMAAAFFRRSKPRSRVIVLDANPGIMAEEATFTSAFNNTYRGMIEYHPNTPAVSVDAERKIVITPSGAVQASVLNVIPPQKAGQIAFDAGLVNFDDRWVGVNLQTFEATAAEDIFVIGDAHGSTVGKSGHFANSEGKLAASAIIAQLAGEPVNPAPTLSNVCYSAITTSSASWFTNTLAYQNGNMAAVPGSVGDTTPTGDHYEDMFGWARNLWADTLG